MNRIVSLLGFASTALVLSCLPTLSEERECISPIEYLNKEAGGNEEICDRDASYLQKSCGGDFDPFDALEVLGVNRVFDDSTWRMFPLVVWNSEIRRAESFDPMSGYITAFGTRWNIALGKLDHSRLIVFSGLYSAVELGFLSAIGELDSRGLKAAQVAILGEVRSELSLDLELESDLDSLLAMIDCASRCDFEKMSIGDVFASQKFTQCVGAVKGQYYGHSED